jgi:hypothetical protein
MGGLGGERRRIAEALHERVRIQERGPTTSEAGKGHHCRTQQQKMDTHSPEEKKKKETIGKED